MGNYQAQCKWCGKTFYENVFLGGVCSKKCKLEYDASGQRKGAVDWNKSALGATVNLVTGSGKPKMTEEEKLAKLKMEQIKKERKEEEKRARIEEEKVQAGIRKQKADVLREGGKPLTAFLVEMNPTYLGAAAVFIGFGLYIGGNKYGTFFVGGIITLIAAFIGFLIKDFFKLENKKGLIITSILVALSIVATIGTYYYKKSKKSNSLVVDEKEIKSPLLQNDQPQTSQNETRKQKSTEEKTEAKLEITNGPTETKEDAVSITFYKVQDPDGYSNLRDKPNGEVIRKVYDNET